VPAGKQRTRLRYRGDGPDVMADAVLRLLRYARRHDVEFTFGPVRLADLERDGLEIVGVDLEPVMQLLAAVPGLAQVDL